LDLSRCCLGSFYRRRSRRWTSFCRSSRACWLAADLCRRPTTAPPNRRSCLRSCCCLSTFWCAMTGCSRRYRRYMMGRTWCWRGLFMFSRYELVIGSTRFLPIASKLATPLRGWRRHCRRDEDDRLGGHWVCQPLLGACAGRRQPLLGFFRCLYERRWVLSTSPFSVLFCRRCRRQRVGGRGERVGGLISTHSFIVILFLSHYIFFTVC
jgi:hypothetical protein